MLKAELLEKRKSFIIHCLYWSIIIFIVYFSFKNLIFYVMPFLIGFGVAFFMKPVIEWFCKKLGIPRKWTAVLVMILFYLVLGTLLFFLGTKLYLWLIQRAELLPEFLKNNLEPTLHSLFSQMERLILQIAPALKDSVGNLQTTLVEMLSGALSSFSGGLLSFLSSFVSAIPSFFISLLVSIISSFFFAVDYHSITAFFSRQLSLRFRSLLLDAKGYLVGTVLKLFFSYVCILLITFAELSVGFLLLGIENAITLAALTALVDILPVFGTGLVLIPWALISLIRHQYFLGIGLLVIYIVITIVRNIIEPKIIGKQVGLHPLVTLFAMILGIKLFGFPGLFLLPALIIVLKNLNDSGKIHLFK